MGPHNSKRERLKENELSTPREPVVLSVFFQANTVKGYRFWDEAGLLANKYVERFRRIDYGSIPHTLTCAVPADPADWLTELRVSPHSIWLSYRAHVPWVTVRQETSGQVDWIARAIGVTQFSRLGLRINLLWEQEGQEQAVEAVLSRILHIQERGWSQLGTATGGSIVETFTADHLEGRIEISSVMNVQREERLLVGGEPAQATPELDDLPSFGVNVDVDLARHGSIESLDVKPHLNRSVKYIENVLTPFMTRLLGDSSDG
ncbi:MAG TPA: hypothetical protein VFB58_02960 [Chloroflexota bacterium]|nr:hypothetical protein [Chloroflexota bacterium]